MGRKESNQTVNKQNIPYSVSGLVALSSLCAGCLLVTYLTARENVKSISFDIWQHKYLLAFKPCENCYSLHENMANTNSIVVAAIDSEYFAIIFAKRDRGCRGRRFRLMFIEAKVRYEVCLDCFTAPSYELYTRSVQQSKVCRKIVIIRQNSDVSVTSVTLTSMTKALVVIRGLPNEIVM